MQGREFPMKFLKFVDEEKYVINGAIVYKYQLTNLSENNCQRNTKKNGEVKMES